MYTSLDSIFKSDLEKLIFNSRHRIRMIAKSPNAAKGLVIAMLFSIPVWAVFGVALIKVLT